MCNGTIITKEYEADGFGNYIIIKGDDGKGFLYAHMADPSPLSVGDTVNVGDYVGWEGTTGSSTGIHLHLEMQDLSNRRLDFWSGFIAVPKPSRLYGNTK